MVFWFTEKRFPPIYLSTYQGDIDVRQPDQAYHMLLIPFSLLYSALFSLLLEAAHAAKRNTEMAKAEVCDAEGQRHVGHAACSLRETAINLCIYQAISLSVHSESSSLDHTCVNFVTLLTYRFIMTLPNQPVSQLGAWRFHSTVTSPFSNRMLTHECCDLNAIEGGFLARIAFEVFNLVSER